MPFPAVLLWGTVAAAAGVGLKKGYDAHCNLKEAKEIGERAERSYRRAKRHLDSERESTNFYLVDLGKPTPPFYDDFPENRPEEGICIPYPKYGSPPPGKKQAEGRAR